MDNKKNYNIEDDDEMNEKLKYYFILFLPCIFFLLFILFLYIIKAIVNRNLIYKENVKLNNLEYDDNMVLNDICSICLDKLNIIDIEKVDSFILKTECNHVFHRYCILNDSIIKCPICRETIKFKSYCIIKSRNNSIIKSSGESFV